MDDEAPSAPEKRISPDGHSIAIRTILDEDAHWLAGNGRGISSYLTDAQVSDWTVWTVV